MAATPKFKVFDANGTYQASCKEPSAAAALLSAVYHNGTIRLSHSKRDIVWQDVDGSSGDSYDHVVNAIYQAMET